jgi:Bacteriocin-protection, YdeI or OmpD-Associated/Domain of unknown function (DUF1905)
MRFRSVVELGGRTATGIPVPDEVVEALGAGRRPAVHVSIGGHAYRSSVASRGGRFLVPLSAENRQAAGVVAGDEVDVELELDTEPREVSVPADLARALDDDPDARKVFEELPYSHRLRWVLSVEDAKTEQTRQRRIAKTVAGLRAGGR